MNYQQQFFFNKMASLFDRLNIQKPKAFTERGRAEKLFNPHNNCVIHKKCGHWATLVNDSKKF